MQMENGQKVLIIKSYTVVYIIFSIQKLLFSLVVTSLVYKIPIICWIFDHESSVFLLDFFNGKLTTIR